MERCPVELWATILEYACVDGGYTGCSLSLVSRGFHTIGQPSRYHSVAVTSPRRCIALAAALAAQPSAPLIRHLFISFPWIADPTHPGAQDALRTAAPHVRVLVVHEPYVFNRVAEPAPAFPALEALALPQLHSLVGRAGAGMFPALRRVRLDTVFHVRETCDKLATCAPRMTHLRVAFRGRDHDVHAFLRAVLDTPTGPTDRYPSASAGTVNTRARSALSTLQHVYLQLSARRSCRKCVAGAGEHSCLHQELENTARMHNEQSVWKLWVLSEQQEYSLDEARRDWEDLVVGGDGPWP